MVRIIWWNCFVNWKSIVAKNYFLLVFVSGQVEIVLLTRNFLHYQKSVVCFFLLFFSFKYSKQFCSLSLVITRNSVLNWDSRVAKILSLYKNLICEVFCILSMLSSVFLLCFLLISNCYRPLLFALLKNSYIFRV